MSIEYKSFNDFIAKASELAKFYDNIEQIRKTSDKEILNSFYNIGRLNNKTKQLLESETNNIKFSLDSLVKNKLHHNELTINDYIIIQDILKSPDKIVKDTDRTLQIFKIINKKAYQLVVKSTKNKKENFITSFHLTNIKRIKK